MSDYAALARFYAAWLLWWAKDSVREMWAGIPGPWPVKVAVMGVLLFMLVTPGPDEFIALAVLRGIRWLTGRRKRA